MIRYGAPGDSTRSAADAVFGFTGGEDRIDLAAVGTAIGGWGTTAFVAGTTFTGARQVAWDAATRILRVEADGDTATTEMMILFGVNATLAAGDIIFA